MNATILYKTVANNRIIYYWLKHSLFMTDNRESSSSYEPPLVADQSGVGSIENSLKHYIDEISFATLYPKSLKQKKRIFG